MLLAASLQALFLAALLASQRRRTLADSVLGLWLGLLGAHTFIYYLHGAGVPVPPIVVSLNAGFPFLQGPFLYFYVDTLTRPRPALRAVHLAHLAPLAAFVAWSVPTLLSSGAPGAVVEARHVFSLPIVLTAWLLLAVPAYVVWALVRIRALRADLEQTVSNVDRIDLGWLRFLVSALGLVWVVVLATFFVRNLAGRPHAAPTHLIFVAVAAFVYAVGFFGFRQRAVFADDAEAEPPPGEAAPDHVPTPTGTATEQSPGKYAKSGLAREATGPLHGRLVDFMETEKPYLEEQLTLRDLARRLGVSANHLSQVVNTVEGQSFFGFVNAYRVRAVGERLREGSARDASLLDVALSCGFGSKSVFNRIFKERTGLTPSAYRRRALEGTGSTASATDSPSGVSTRRR